METRVEGLNTDPGKIVDLGSRQIYGYKDLKVPFLNDQVTDVQ